MTTDAVLTALPSNVHAMVQHRRARATNANGISREGHALRERDVALAVLLERIAMAVSKDIEWLMGFPLAWTALERLVTPSSPKSRKS